MNRFEYERAVEKSQLPRGPRDVLFALARRYNNEAGCIPQRFRPSVTDLQQATGMSRRGVFYSLAIAAEQGWVTRYRPDPVVQRQWKNTAARTEYVLHLPGELVQRRPARHDRIGDMLDRAAARAAGAGAVQ